MRCITAIPICYPIVQIVNLLSFPLPHFDPMPKGIYGSMKSILGLCEKKSDLITDLITELKEISNFQQTGSQGFGANSYCSPSLSPGKTATTLPIRSLSLSKYWGYSTSDCIFCQGTENTSLVSGFPLLGFEKHLVMDTRLNRQSGRRGQRREHFAF